MHKRINLVALGVDDLAASVAFYERLGFVRHPKASNNDIAFFQLGPMVLSLFGRDALAEDAGLPAGERPAFSGVTLAQNVESPEAVVATLDAAVAAGAKLLKPGQKVFWGGFSGYFADPDGHAWEVAHNPFFALDDNGMIALPG